MQEDLNTKVAISTEASMKEQSIDHVNRIEALIASSRVFLFMKGSPDQPYCGFSAKVVAILKDNGCDYKHFDILQDEGMRNAVKIYSKWPTFPQLYVDGNLIGGCDIVYEMYKTGQLEEVLK